MLIINAASLLYCVVTMPVELALLDDLDFCTPVPMLPVDMATDLVFVVSPHQAVPFPTNLRGS